MSEFLENLKKAADNGEFNSDAAKKILEINELADKKLGAGTPADLEKIQESLDKRVEADGQIKERKAVSEEEVVELNSQYEKKMADIKKQDAINGQVAMLIEVEDMVKLTIEDMFGLVDELESRFEKEFEAEDPMFGELSQKIEQIKSIYKPIINK